ncbi:MAG: hypothetical protein QOI61_798 [Actinomycetota bacterium]|jgi:peptidoglycan/xylan/chitin deacetylase (PgdA/CDA1 family)
MKTWLRRTVIALPLVLVLLQAVPYGYWGRSNPPVIADAPWPNAEVASLARAACYACHSNETHWPIYSYVAPMSWLVRHDVDDGRDKLNFSEWNARDADDAADALDEGSMPPGAFTLLHPDARLSDAQKRQVLAALRQMGDGDHRGPG